MAQIIPKNAIQVEPHWQKELGQAFTDPEKLFEYLQIDTSALQNHFLARRLFAMRVPRPFAAKIAKGEINDPLLLQVMPMQHEFEMLPGFSADPLEEHATAAKGVLHKYQNRVLLILRGGCAVNCRYCFRRHFPYQDNALKQADWEGTLDYLRKHKEVNEVILSGGDPLMANDTFLTWLIAQLDAITHIKRLRIHTRLPVVIPARINSELLSALKQFSRQKIMVFHINHKNEIDSQLDAGCQQLKQAGVYLLNQAVLLKGVNDSVDEQVQLSEALFAVGIMPYYLHLLDKVMSAAHFLVEDETAKAIMREVYKCLPGFLVPKLVREIGGEASKTPVDLNLHPT